MQIEKVELFIKNILQSKLSPLLMYHTYGHTLDVTNMAMVIANDEGITDQKDLLLLKTAGLFHDCGYIKEYNNHEVESCNIAKANLPLLGYSEEQIKAVCNMIMKTKLPSRPRTILEKILCDADLDYLGRDDFRELGDKLFKEFLNVKKVHDKKEWNLMQLRFLKSHHYWTKSAQKRRDQKKAEHLKELADMVKRQ